MKLEEAHGRGWKRVSFQSVELWPWVFGGYAVFDPGKPLGPQDWQVELQNAHLAVHSGVLELNAFAPQAPMWFPVWEVVSEPQSRESAAPSQREGELWNTRCR